MPIKRTAYTLVILLFTGLNSVFAQQTLTLKNALEMAVQNYGTIRAKSNYAGASQAGIKQARREYLPNLNLGAQQVYGTVNGQNGPLYGFGGLGVASSGLPLPEQSWHAAFGALYLTNVNWDFFAFGRAKNRIEVAKSVAGRDSNDLKQEIFQHKVKTAAAYLNLLAAQRLAVSYQKNLNRVDTFRRTVAVRARNGLIAGVDSSQADAELSNARITLTQARNAEQQRAKELAVLLGAGDDDFVLDTLFVSQIPAQLAADGQSKVDEHHPLLDFYKSRIAVSDRQAKYYRSFSYPAFTFVGIFQGRASGFSNNYAQDQSAFSHDYWDGISPTRANYLVGIGLTWNITQPLRISQQVKAQRLTSKGLEEEMLQTDRQLKADLAYAEKNISNSLNNYREAPVQVEAASRAYLQRTVLYRNGLTNLVDVTQAAYALIRAETDRDIAYNNVWQALLMKAASAGDFTLFDSKIND
ncbi:MAG: TolC family protein [Mucilaginibacter polytrichastri]|nr:TolC family protein [Mucilaginibacter polytrichastri]